MSGKFMMNGIEYLGGGSGGGGNVDDVLINGTSVVNEDKEAEIVSYMEITRAEYDLLPDTKYSDGIMYCITDGFNNANGFPPLIYSTEEREVGVWIDGKSLYQKTIAVTFETSNTVYEIESNIDKFMFVPEATFKIQNNSSNVTNYGFYVSATDRVQVYYRPSDHKLIVMSVSSDIAGDGFITYRYTKTTDTAGSGRWATDGGLAKHYSTQEQIIGTWIDGKPLYQKTFFYPGPYSGNANHELPLLSGIEFVSFSMLVGKNQDGLSLVIPYVNAATQYSVAVWILADSSKFNLATYGGNTITNLVAVVNYTKTTN